MFNIEVSSCSEAVNKIRPLRPGVGEPRRRRKRGGGGGRAIGGMRMGVELAEVVGRGGFEF